MIERVSNVPTAAGICGSARTVKDRNLFTGQNPASAGPLAAEFMKELS